MTKLDFSGPIWSVLVVDAEGKASFDRVGLKPGKARQRAEAILKTKVGKTHQVVHHVAPCDEENFKTNGTYVITYLLAGWPPYIHAVGLEKNEAERFAKKVIENLGPDAPREKNDCRLCVAEVLVIDAPEIMEMLGMSAPV